MAKHDQPNAHENLSFASELIKARNDLGLTQSELSTKSGVSLSAIKGYESGRNVPGTRELRELCKTLRVTPNKLLFGVETPFATLGDENPARASDDKVFDIQRGRIALLANLLSFDECSAMYLLANSIAVGRHGVEVVNGHISSADFITGLMRLNARKGIEVDVIPKNPEFLRELIPVLRYAVEIAEISGDSPNLSVDLDELIKMVSKK